MAGEIVVFVTAAAKDEAEKIGSALVGEHLAACVNIIPEIRSFFFWQGKLQAEHEVLLVCKSRLPLLDKLTARVKALHSYTVPEIVALPIIGGAPEYLAWLHQSTPD